MAQNDFDLMLESLETQARKQARSYALSINRVSRMLARWSR